MTASALELLAQFPVHLTPCPDIVMVLSPLLAVTEAAVALSGSLGVAQLGEFGCAEVCDCPVCSEGDGEHHPEPTQPKVGVTSPVDPVAVVPIA
jgi:hypothetical protein